MPQELIQQGISTSLLVRNDKSVVLPAGRELAQDAKAQEAVVLRVLPSGVRHEVLAQLQSEEEQRSPAQWMLIACLLVGCLIIVWRYFPVQPPVESLEASIQIETCEVPKDSPFYGLYELSKKRFEEKKYARCAEELASAIPELMEKHRELGDSHNRLLYYFFESVRVGRINATTRKMAEKYIDVFASLNRDDMKWEIMRVKLRAQEFLRVDVLHTRLTQRLYEHNWRDRLVAVDRWCDDVRQLTDNMERQALSQDATEETLENLSQLKYSLACLLVSRWMLEGGRGTCTFPDDYGDLGVSSREEALRICLETEESTRPLGRTKRALVEFLRLRRFIAETILAQSDYVNKYYWNGSVHFRNDELKREIALIRDRLKNTKGK